MIGAPATVNVIAPVIVAVHVNVIGPVGVIAPVDADSSSPRPSGRGYAATVPITITGAFPCACTATITGPITITGPLTFGAIARSPEQIAYAYVSTVRAPEFVSVGVSDPGTSEPPGLQPLGGSAAYTSTGSCS